MALTDRLHPLLIHFPIALVLAAAAEAAALVSRDPRWRAAAVVNLRAGALFAALAAATGWRFVSAAGIDATPLLEWHRSVGTAAAAAAVAAAVAEIGAERNGRLGRVIHRIALMVAAALVGAAGHLGGLLVWGEHFFRF